MNEAHCTICNGPVSKQLTLDNHHRFKDDCINNLKGMIRNLLDLIEHGIPERGHSGPCGPEAGCDGICMDVVSYVEIITTAHKILDAK